MISNTASISNRYAHVYSYKNSMLCNSRDMILCVSGVVVCVCVRVCGFVCVCVLGGGGGGGGCVHACIVVQHGHNEL